MTTLTPGAIFKPLPKAKKLTPKLRNKPGWIENMQRKVMEEVGANVPVQVNVFPYDEGQRLFHDGVTRAENVKSNRHNSHATATASEITNWKPDGRRILPGFRATYESIVSNNNPQGYTVLTLEYDPEKQAQDLAGVNKKEQ